MRNIIFAVAVACVAAGCATKQVERTSFRFLHWSVSHFSEGGYSVASIPDSNGKEMAAKYVKFLDSVDADVKFGCKFHKDDSEERNYHFLVYAKDVEDVKSRIEKYIGDIIRENKGYGDLGFFEQILIESDFEVTLKTATTVNCSAVICREFTMQYNPALIT